MIDTYKAVPIHTELSVISITSLYYSCGVNKNFFLYLHMQPTFLSIGIQIYIGHGFTGIQTWDSQT